MKMNTISIGFVVACILMLLACSSNISDSPESPDSPPSVNYGLWSILYSSGSGVNYKGYYGTIGISSPNNHPGSRAAAVSWFDPDGKLWLFGGVGPDSPAWFGFFNDLWRYDLTTSEWTWISGDNHYNQTGIYGIKGIPDASNVPGGRRGAVSWIDPDGKLWLFGGTGGVCDAYQNYKWTYYDYNDLWSYDRATNEWTWVSGSDTIHQAGIYGVKGVPSSSSIPGAREALISWIDASGKLWLFGGYGLDSLGWQGTLNDLWSYDRETHEWTWVSGNDECYQVGTYGIKGVPDPSNVPGARQSSISWIDSDGNLWLFGGHCVEWTGNVGTGVARNDLWKFCPSTNEWTWISGSDSVNQKGNYGTRGISSSSNMPGARFSAVSWIDSTGKLWLFGGQYKDSDGGWGYLHDLWKFDPVTLEWTWMAHGPEPRDAAVSWHDVNNNFWLFGGYGVKDSRSGFLNDFWRYNQ